MAKKKFKFNVGDVVAFSPQGFKERDFKDYENAYGFIKGAQYRVIQVDKTYGDIKLEAVVAQEKKLSKSYTATDQWELHPDWLKEKFNSLFA